MHRNRFVPFTVALILAPIMLTGCGSAVPATVDVTLPDGSVVQSTLGSGVVAFADSTWEFFRTTANGQSRAFMTIRFGPNGELAAFENNTIASDIFGETILFDGKTHGTNQPGLSYSAGTFGAETSDSSGFAFEGRLTAFAAGIQAAQATATASGTFDGDDINTVRGVFEFTSEVTLLDIPEGNISESYDFVGYRVVD